MVRRHEEAAGLVRHHLREREVIVVARGVVAKLLAVVILRVAGVMTPTRNFKSGRVTPSYVWNFFGVKFPT